MIDSQSVRAADTVPKITRGWDNAKKVNGRKRHIAVDTMGLLLAVVITAASVQDRDAARQGQMVTELSYHAVMLAAGHALGAQPEPSATRAVLTGYPSWRSAAGG